MSVLTPIDPPQHPYDVQHGDNDHLHEFKATPSQRIEGWTADKQQTFLQALAEGVTVGHACRVVGLSRQSAYAFRTSSRGAAFALGWDAAVLRSRDVLVDDLMMRAFHGNVDATTLPSGDSVERHRYDNKLGLAMLARLDRMAGAQNESALAAARLIAQDFEPYLDLLARQAGPGRAGLFLAARILPHAARPANDDDLGPVRALARADSWLRTHTDLAEGIDTSDLDPAARADWTAGQWIRAEAAGLVQLAPAPEPDIVNGSCQENRQYVDPENPDGAPVWWSEHHATAQWRTRYPPPEGFYGDEDGEYGEDGYSRELTAGEEEVWEAPYRAEVEAQRAAEAIERDALFAPAPPALPEPSTPAKRSSRHKAHSAPGSREYSMSIFGRIKDAIFGHKAAAAPEPDPVASAPTATAPTPQNQQATPAPAQASPVDVERVLTEKLAAKGNPDLNWRTSIVDLMKLLDLDSSLDNRKELATELGYAGAKDGSAEMNLWLHNAVMLELVNNGARVPEKLAD